MKEGTRLYINITNKCNTNCPFCCMYSGSNKNNFMNFNTFKHIIDNCKDKFELQLEGGEPTIHKELYLFIEYAISTGRCTKIILLTNGIELDKHMHRILNIVNWYKINVEIKVSVNYWLLDKDENSLEKLNKLIFATKYIENLDIKLNVRKRKEDDWIDQELKDFGLYDYSNIFYLQSYGKLSKSDKYDKPIIVQNIANWEVYASDGENFGQDLIARSEYEKSL